MAIESTTIITLYDDAAKTKAFAPRTKVEAISNNSGTGLQSLLDAKMNADNNKFTNGIEIHHATTPFVDFHYENNQGDYTSRIIESSSGTLDVNGVTFNSSKITSGTWNGSTIGVAYGGTGLTASPSMLINLGSTSAANVLQASPRPGVTGTLAVANGGTGKTVGKDAANYFLNELDTGSSTPVDADYYISQYVSGGTTTTTYHRRPMSALWTYIKGKSDSTYVNVSGDTMTGDLTATRLIASNTNAVKHLEFKRTNNPTYICSNTGSSIQFVTNAKAVGDAQTDFKIASGGGLYKGSSTPVPAVFISSSTPTALQTGDIWFVT